MPILLPSLLFPPPKAATILNHKSIVPLLPLNIVLTHLYVFLKSIHFYFSCFYHYKKGLCCMQYSESFLPPLNKTLLRFIHIATLQFHSFLLLCNIPLCDFTTIYSSTLLFIRTWVVFINR